MKFELCGRCKKGPAVLYITKVDKDGNKTREGICPACAAELNIQPFADMIKSMGITAEDLRAAMENGEGGEMMISPEMLNGMIAPAAPDEQPDEQPDEPARAPALSIFNIFKRAANSEEQEQEDDTPDAREKKRRKQAEKKKTLSQFATDLTAKAREGKVDRVIGREPEIQRVIQILNRRQKNNPCLIGEPGVGKTAVAEGLAKRIADKTVPQRLLDKEVWLLDMSALVAGTQFRGQFEARVKKLIDEVNALGNVILVIDEVHTLVGTGDAEGGMNAANILKPALSRGEIQVIGATTFKEYRKYIEKDSALERRFQPVTIAEPSAEETVEILLGVKGYYETFHGVIAPEAIIAKAVYLADRYINDRFMPDKAIDLLDEACSALNLRSPHIAQIPLLQAELDERMDQQMQLEQGEQTEDIYARIAENKSRMLQLEDKLSSLRALPPPVLTIDDLAQVIEIWTKIPASRIREDEYQRLINLADNLKAHIIGQDEACDSAASAIRRRRAGLSDRRKPVSFIFAGPTGVGKTELVKQLANELFASHDALIRLDMSEYMEPHSVSKLIGAPPGYVGYDEAGQLTEKLRRRPYSVVLFDEIEKAHHDVLNMLLQILDEGRITDAQGRYVSFENAVVVMTSNAGSDEASAAVGFGGTQSSQNKDKTMKALKKIMRPEFLNRVDEIIAFNHLNEDDIVKICDLMLNELKTEMAKNGLELSWTEDAKNLLAKKGFSVTYGARNLRRIIEKEVEDKAAMLIIQGYENPVSRIIVTTENDEIKISAE
ncbi:MAG: ATP-dependent Clp protease ATP-binding subunit [Clostridia bacterium]|nr:ATP-dependent Clp protease ATP-binding subunit [Clostridia bacterium]